jgi:hypothetical protein
MINRYTFVSCFFLFLLVGTASLAQIPNASFENWTGGNPDGWNTLNNSIVYVTQTNDAHEGSSAAKSTAASPGGPSYVVSFIYSGTAANNFFPCNCRPDALHFWYILHPAGNETLSAYVGGNQNGSTVAAGASTFTSPTGVYTEGIVNIAYSTPGNMDSMSISFLMSGDPAYHDGTFFIIDDLSWGAVGTGVGEQNQTAAALESISPNPTSGTTRVVYSLSQSADVRLEIYDAVGRLVKTVFHEKQTAGHYKAVNDMSDLAVGIYTCKLSVDGRSFNQTFAVSR